MSTIEIITNKDDYTGGDIVSGVARLCVTEPIIARGVRIRFNAYEHAYWTTGSGKNRSTHSKYHYYVNEEKTVFGQEPLSTLSLMADAVKGVISKAHYEVLQPDTYEYEFSFQLPDVIPGDYETGGNAKIAYELTAYVDIPLKFDLQETKKLTVYESHDESLAKPVSGGNAKTFMLDSAGPLEMKVKTDTNMYFPGDKGFGEVEITNKSSKEIDAVTVSICRVLDMKTDYRSTSRKHDMEVNRMDKPTIPKGKPTTFKFDFVVPEDLYCTITTGQIMKIYYELVVNLDVPWAIDLETRLPIVLLEEQGVPSGFKRKPE